MRWGEEERRWYRWGDEVEEGEQADEQGSTVV